MITPLRTLGVSALTLTWALALAAPALAAPAKKAAPPTAKAAPAATAERVVLPANVAPQSYDISITPDIKAATFTGHVDIALDVKAATTTIKLNAADLTFSKVSLSGAAGAPTVSFNAEEQTATLTFAAPLSAGAHVLSIDYAGKIATQAAGLFSLPYDTKEGRKTALFTQFENSDARRFVPSWDEPNRKATFKLSAVVPADQMAISNMPEASSQKIAGGLKKVTFAASPKMSSYLLYFGLGDFERIHQDVDGTDVGVIFKRGDAEQAKFALDASVHILRYYNDYFGVKYPLPKLDHIAGPGQSQFFGAMENWGAIFYFERVLLIDPKTSTEGDKQNVYIVVAHEMAHQWFGDLVTMDWWDDLWLNEGFASWMESKATSQFHPEWKLNLQDLGAKEAAMRLDARTGTHPIIAHIKDVAEAQQAFDDITYQKGQAVIGMLESYVGEDAWRAGVRAYMKKHAYGNTTTDDLWREIDAASSLKITDIAHDFTKQPGVPLVEAKESCAGNVTTTALTQGRFGVDVASKAPLTWRVPVRAQYAGSANVQRGVVSATAPKTFKIDGCGPVVVNAGQTAYFRTAYDDAGFAKVLGAYPTLPSVDQLGVSQDSAALGLAGYRPIGRFLDLSQATPADADPIVWAQVVAQLTAFDGYFDGLPQQPAYRAWARKAIAPLYAKLGWDKKAGEADNVALQRATVLRALSQLDDPAVIAEARKRFAGFVKDQDSVQGGTRRTMLRIVALHADAATWEQLHQLAKTAPTALTKDEYYTLLAAAEDKALAQKALELMGTSEPEATTRPTMLRTVAGQHGEMAFDFYLAHKDALEALVEPNLRPSIAPRLAANATDPAAMADRLEAFAAKNTPAGARGDVVKTLASLRYRAEIKRLRTPEIAAWVAKRGG